MKEGSGTALTIKDISNALERSGCTVYLAQNPLKDSKARLVVYPPRHIVTEEDVRLETEERKLKNEALDALAKETEGLGLDFK